MISHELVQQFKIADQNLCMRAFNKAKHALANHIKRYGPLEGYSVKNNMLIYETETVLGNWPLEY